MGLFSPSKKDKKKNYVLRPAVLKASQSVPNLNMNRDAAGSSSSCATRDVVTENSEMSESVEKTQNESETIQCGMDRYTLVINKRKRTVSNEKSIVPTLKKQLTNEFKIITKNKFDCLPESVEKIDKPVNEKPPPIYLREIINKDFLKKLLSIAENKLFVSPIKRGNINETKIQIFDIPHYRLVVDALEKCEKKFYTFQLKSSRGLRVVIKGIESNISPADIKEDLESQGFKIKNVSNIVNSQKIPQPMFRVELEPEAAKIKGSHPIYEIKYVLYRRIQIEEPHKNRNPVQCFNCQEYGHTFNYCHLRQICVICSEAHDTKECPKDKNSTTVKKCSNCGENHTANYKGCLVYLQLKQKLSSRLTEKKEKTKGLKFLNPVAVNKPSMSNITSNVKSYSGILTNKQDNLQQIQTNESVENNTNVIKMIDALNSTVTKFIQSMETNMTMMLQLMNNLVQLQSKNHK